jgi:methylglutaconyl-CoA hydratase
MNMSVQVPMQTIISSTDKRGVLTLCMNRPRVHNAFDAGMIHELTAALMSADQDDDVRLVVITGAGSCFSAGADLNWMRSLVKASKEENEDDAMQLANLMRQLNYLTKPTVARINGAAFGGGLGLIAACDVSIAADTALFGLTETRLGLVPAVISPYVIRRIGETHARRYFLSAERFDSQRACEIGLIQQSVTAAELDAVVEELIGKILEGGPLAVKQCKQLAFEISGHSAASQKLIDETTVRLIASLRVSDEGQEGLAAFLEKRKPRWVNK